MSKSGNRYCITLTDYFSKWVEAAPIPTKEATHVAVFLYKMILRHGYPQEIVSDQGREFCNKLVDSLEELTGFKHKITSAYHPQSNALDECFNQITNAEIPAAKARQRPPRRLVVHNSNPLVGFERERSMSKTKAPERE